jgi:glycosyltransferase involved in cell wall biosynthesis
MRICFIDPNSTDYRVDTPYEAPIGGIQAAGCYLSEALAAIGHDIALWNKTTRPGVVRKVACHNLASLPADFWGGWDAVVLMSAASLQVVQTLRSAFGPRCRFVLWCQHAADQPGVKSLEDPEVAGFFDAYAMVSAWQGGEYIRRFGLPQARVHVLRNAANPAFETLFAADEDVAAAKGDGSLLAYSSAPYRGLVLVAGIFPRLRQRVPDARLMVFSGPRAEERDAQMADPVFRALLGMEGVVHVGSLPQPELTRRLKEVGVLMYPNTFAETSCISVIEALAAGCRVVTSNLGGLPETTATFGTLREPLLSVEGLEAYMEAFADTLAGEIAFLRSSPAAGERLRLQVDYARYNRWSMRAREWEHMLGRLAVPAAG